MAIDVQSRHDFIFSRRTDTDTYRLWRVDYSGGDLLRSIPLDEKAELDKTHQIAPIGRYLLEWGPIQLVDYQPCFPYRLFEFDPRAETRSRPGPSRKAPG